MSLIIYKILIPDTLEALTSLVKQSGAIPDDSDHDLNDGSFAARRPRPARFINIRIIVSSLYEVGLLNSLQPTMDRLGLDMRIIPTATLLGVYSTCLVPWIISKFAKASVKLMANKRADTAEYIVQWAARQSSNEEKSGKGRHLTISEQTKRFGKDRLTSFKVLRSDVESWTVVWKDRVFLIRVEHRADLDDEAGKRKQQWNSNSWEANNNNYDDYSDEGD